VRADAMRRIPGQQVPGGDDPGGKETRKGSRHRHGEGRNTLSLPGRIRHCGRGQGHAGEDDCRYRGDKSKALDMINKGEV
jgi:hypothetical protein